MYLGDDRRYEVRRKLGDGTFGRVVECIDHNRRCRVAVKIIRDVKRYVENARIEARILERVNEIRRLSKDHQGGRGVVRLYDTFFHSAKHYCLSFEKLGKTLLEVIQLNNHCGFYLFDIKQISLELLETLDFIHTRCGLSHTDIKMENIMLTGYDFICTKPPPRVRKSGVYQRPVLLSEQSRGRHKSIRLIDFGNGVFSGDHHSTTINTRQYRSPEVILERAWDTKSDMWSAGCVIAEMFTGELLFGTHSNLEHLAMIQRVVEDSPLLAQSPKYANRFGRLNWPDGCESSDSFRSVNEAVALSKMFYFHPSLLDLVSKLLRIDPDRRYSAGRAVDRSEFLYEKIPINE